MRADNDAIPALSHRRPPIYPPKGFVVNRTQSKDEEKQHVARYTYSMDLHLDLMVVEEAECDEAHLKAGLDYGMRQFLINVKRRCEELLG